MNPARRYVAFHLSMMVFWAGLVIPTLLFWKNSVLWVAFLSLYANMASHFAGFNASLADMRRREETENENTD